MTEQLRSNKTRGRVVALWMFSVVLGCVGFVANAQQARPVPQTQRLSGNVINLKDADIRAFIEDISVLTGKTFIVDPRVTGAVTVSSQAHLSKSEIFSVFMDVLRVRGFTAIPTQSGAYRITLIQGAAQDAPLRAGHKTPGAFVTEILELKHGDAANAARLIKPIMHSQGRLTSTPGGRVLVITDYPENVTKARKIIAAMDVDKAAIETIALKNISASDAKNAVKELMGTGRPQIRNNILIGETVKAVAIDATNTLVLRGDPAAVSQLKQMILQMDQASLRQRGQVSVIPLHYADGEKIIEVLNKILPSYTSIGKSASKPSVAHEAGSNSIIISASPKIQESLEGIVRRLDVRRPQVLVEAIIVEISDNVAEDLGLQFLLAGNEDSALPLISTNYSRTAPNLLAVAGAVTGNTSSGTGTTSTTVQGAAISQLVGLNGGTFGIGGRGNSGLFGAILNAVENDTNSNVLSKPFLTTMDNQPAKFNVGQNVPFITGQTLGNNNQNPFQTIQRKDVGITLEVTPQISDGDVIQLDIKQTVDSISNSATQASDIITNTRSIETVVLANDGDIIVLGGLMQNDEQLFESKVPVLGDIPGIGNLFKSHNNSNKRTNLMVFIRPVIIRNGEDARPLTKQKLDILRRLEKVRNPEEPSRIDRALQDMALKGK